MRADPYTLQTQSLEYILKQAAELKTVKSLVFQLNRLFTGLYKHVPFHSKMSHIIFSKKIKDNIVK